MAKRAHFVRYWEIPPRVRRRGTCRCGLTRRIGNTSACAEKRNGLPIVLYPRWKYLRVCGEEKNTRAATDLSTEIPPRVRRRDLGMFVPALRPGNTSACAEKRVCGNETTGSPWKYLRVYGEETGSTGGAVNITEIPPRVRRRGPILGSVGYE